MQAWGQLARDEHGSAEHGRSEGSEIIQLFGRGVRLQGLNRSLKRSSALTGIEHPAGIDLLERLNIFAIRANYMVRFRGLPGGARASNRPAKSSCGFPSNATTIFSRRS